MLPARWTTMVDNGKDERDLLVDYDEKQADGELAKIKIILLGDSAVGKSKSFLLHFLILKNI